MNILMIAHETELGGASLSLLGMIDILRENHEITVLSAKRSGPLLSELEKRGIPVIIRKLYCWTLPKEKSSPIRRLVQRAVLFGNYLALPGLVGEIKKRQIELIHSNTSILPVGGLLHKKTGLPHIWHVREFVEQDFGMKYVLGKKRTRHLMEKNSSRIVVISKALLSEYESYVNQEKIQCIYNGVSIKGKAVLPNEIKKQITEEKDRDCVPFLIAGKVSEHKGQIEALEALSLLTNGKKNKAAVLWIAGDGMLTECKQKAEELGVSDRVHFLGRIDYLEALRPHMRAELVCSACEAFGRVTIEAYLAGIPVIGTNTGGTPELIEDGKTGFLYRKGDIEELAAHMRRVIEAEEECCKMGQKGKEFAQKYFTAERNASEVEKLYQEAVSGH